MMLVKTDGHEHRNCMPEYKLQVLEGVLVPLHVCVVHSWVKHVVVNRAQC